MGVYRLVPGSAFLTAYLTFEPREETTLGSKVKFAAIDPFLGILVAMVFILEVKPSRPVSQFQASLTKLSALLQVGVQFRYNVEL